MPFLRNIGALPFVIVERIINCLLDLWIRICRLWAAASALFYIYVRKHLVAYFTPFYQRARLPLRNMDLWHGHQGIHKSKFISMEPSLIHIFVTAVTSFGDFVHNMVNLLFTAITTRTANLNHDNTQRHPWNVLQYRATVCHHSPSNGVHFFRS